jgi:hypothetical protein
MIDRILLGHNQFFGVNHLDAQVGSKKAAQFADISNILNIIHFSMDQGVHAMMMSTHERALLLSKAIQKDKELKEQLGIYLLVPYIAKYVKQANEKGIVNIIMDSLKGTRIQDQLGMFMRGGVGMLTRDINTMITLLIDFEVAPFHKLNLKAIFLHDAITDLALGWDLPEVLELFSTHVEKKYKAIPAFCTKNLPKLMELLKQTSVQNPLIMASINKLGYQVNPSLEAFEKCLQDTDLQLLAMSTLASGYLKPKEAYDYLFSLPQVESVVVGVSRKDHAKETFQEIQNHFAGK